MSPNIFVAAMGPVARELMGEPSSSSTTELRWGTNGGFRVDLAKGVWCDYGDGNEGGGVIAFVQRQLKLSKPDAVRWLVERKYIPPLERTKSGGKQISKIYDYRSRTGDLLYQVVRYEPKGFNQRRPDGSGGWIWKTDKAERVLYRLPELIRAVADKQAVYIAEGEKGVEALEALGLTGTCSPGGAGKWQTKYSAGLAGADVVILPDYDPQSLDHAGEPLWHPDGGPKRPSWRIGASMSRPA